MQSTAPKLYYNAAGMSGTWPAPLLEPAKNALPSASAMPPDLTDDEDEAFLKLLYGELSRRLLPAVDAVLERYGTDGGAVLDEQIDRETLAFLVDEIVNEAAAYSADIEEITLNTAAYQERWGCYRLLHALAEALALRQLKLRRTRCSRRNRNMVDIII